MLIVWTSKHHNSSACLQSLNHVLIAQDYENIKRGIYKMPWDFATPGHRQTNPINVLSQSFR